MHRVFRTRQKVDMRNYDIPVWLQLPLFMPYVRSWEDSFSYSFNHSWWNVVTDEKMSVQNTKQRCYGFIYAINFKKQRNFFFLGNINSRQQLNYIKWVEEPKNRVLEVDSFGTTKENSWKWLRGHKKPMFCFSCSS